MPTPAEMITKFVQIEDLVNAETAKFDEWAKPYRQAMETIKNEIGAALLQSGQKNFLIEGVAIAYTTTNLSTKVDNRDDFLQFVTSQNAWNFLDARVLKDPVRDWMDKGALEPPPGIKIEPYTKLHIARR